MAFAALGSVPKFEEQYLSVSINGKDLHQITTVLKDQHGNFYVQKSDLAAWRIALPSSKPIFYQSQLYYPLKIYPDIKYDYDFSKQSINLLVPVNSLDVTVVGDGEELKHFKRPCPGGFLNYNLYAYQFERQIQSNNYFELGFFNKYGLGTSSFLAATNTPISNYNYRDWWHGSTSSFTRLLTTWTYDNPDKMTTLHLGDSYNRASSWGNSVYFGGIQYGTNFTTQPTFIYYPLPAIKGVAVLPTATDLYVNGIRRSSDNFPPGPYAINNIPVIDGEGNIRVITTDITGRQQEVNIPFYNINTILKQGLTDYSVETGFVRANYGINSNDYGDFMLVGTRRYGVTDKLTTESHAEVLSRKQSVGYGADYVIGTFGVISGDVAGSNYRSLGQGGLVQVGFQRRTTKYNFYIKNQWQTEQFRQLGTEFQCAEPRMTTQATLGFPWGKGNLGFAYLYQINRGQAADTQVYSGSYVRPFSDKWIFTVSVSRQTGQLQNNAVWAGLTLIIDPLTSASASYNDQYGSPQGSLEYTRSLPVGDGYGYHLATGVGRDAVQQGAFSYRNNYGTYVASASNFQGKQSYALNAYGAVAFLDGVHFTNSIDSGFAEVEVPGFPNVGVYANHGYISKTNKKGKVFLTNLPPYYESSISIDMKDLPLNASTYADEKFISTFPKSGYVVKFPVELSRTGTLTLLQSPGKPVPEGSVVDVITTRKEANETIVGADGLVYLTKLGEKNKLNVYWEDKECSVNLTLPRASMQKEVDDFGILICKREVVK